MTNFKDYNFDNFVRFLEPPAAPIEDEVIGCCHKIAQSISAIAHAIFIFFAKVWNLCFGDHIWYSEFKAREMIKFYFMPENIQKFVDMDKEYIRKLRNVWKCIESPKDIDSISIDWQNACRLNDLSKAVAEPKIASPIPKPQAKAPEELDAEGREYIYRDYSIDLTLTTFFHIHANRFGRNSKLEGANSSDILDYLVNDMSVRVNQDSTLKPLLETYQRTSKLSKSDNFAKDALEAFEKSIKEHRRFQFAAGWRGTPGHAIHIETIPHPENRDVVDIRLYNLGIGALDAQDDKNRTPTYIEWVDIPRENINLKFFNYINEINNTDPIHMSSPFHSGDYYDALKNILCPKSIRYSPFKMRLQDAGICSLRSALSYERTWLQENFAEAGYRKHKRILCDRKLSSFEAIIRMHPSLYRSRRGMFQHSAESTARKIRKLRERNIVGDEYVRSARPALKSIETWMQQEMKMSDVNTKVELCVFPGFYLDPLDKKIFREFDAKSQAEQKSTVARISFAEEIDTSIFIDSTPSSIISKLRSLLNKANILLESGQYFEVYTGLQKFMLLPDVDVNYWIKLCHWDPKIAQSLVEELGNIGFAYFKSCSLIPNPQKIYLETIFPIERFIYILEHLFNIIIKKETAEEYTLFQHGTRENTYTELHPQAVKEAELTRKSEKKQFFPWISKNRQTQTFQFDLISCERFVRLMEKIIGIEEVRDSIGYYQALSAPAKASRIYTSIKILPSWFVSLRNIHLAYMKMSTHTLAVPNLSRRLAFEWVFSAEYETDGFSTYNIELEGMKFEKEKNHAFSFHVYRHFSSNQFRELAEDLIYMPFEDEKDLLVQRAKAKKYNLTPEEYTQIAYPFVTNIGQNFRGFDDFEHIAKPFQNLKSVDHQIFFSMLLHRHVYRARNSLFPEMLHDFINKTSKNYRVEKAIQPYVYLLHISSFLSGIEGYDKFFNFGKILSSLKSILCIDLEPEMRSIVYAELLAQLSRKQYLDKDEPALIVEGWAYLQQFPVPIKYSDSHSIHEGRKALQSHRSSLAKLFDDPSQLSAVMKNVSLFYALPAETTWKLVKRSDKEFPEVLSMDGSYTFDPLSGQISAKEKAFSVILPEEMRLHPDFSSLFPNIVHGISNHNLYEFTDDLGNLNKVKMINSEIFIYRKIAFNGHENWYQYLPKKLVNPASLTSAFGSCYLTKKYTQWHHEGEVLSLDSQGVIQYHTTLSLQGAALNRIERCSDHALLWSCVNFENFECLEYVHVFKKPNDRHYLEIDLPRMECQFFQNYRDELESVQHKDFHLTSLRTPYLDNYVHYRILQGSSGRMKLLLPKFGFKSSRDVSKTRYSINYYGESTAITVFAYDMPTLEGPFVASSTVASLHLALVLGITQKYTESFAVLNQVALENSTFNATEIEALKELLSITKFTGDTSGNAAAIQTYAGTILLRYGLLTGKDRHLVEMNVQNHYLNYLNKYNTVTIPRLKEHQEKFLLRTFLKYHPSESFHFRLLELDPFQASLYTPTLFKIAPRQNSLIKICTERVWYDLQSGFKSPGTITHSRLNLQFNFLYYYQLAISDKEDEKAEFRNDLKFFLASPSIDYQALGIIFECLLQFGSNFPKITITSGYLDLATKTAIYHKFEEWIPQVDIQKLLPTPYEQEKLQHTLYRLRPPEPVLDMSSFKCDWTPSTPQNEESFTGYFTISEEAEAKESSFDLIKVLEPLGKTIPEFNNDPVFQSEMKRLKEDMEAHKKNKVVRKKVEMSANHPNFSAHVLGTLIFIGGEIEDLRKEVLVVINTFPDSEDMLHVKRIAGEWLPWSIDDAVINFARQDHQALRRHNPTLSVKAISKVYEDLHKLTLLETKRQKLERIDAAIKEGDTQKIYDECSAVRNFDPTDKRFLIHLVFEFIANILLRKNQIDKIDEFLKTGDLGKIHEMIMGWGKSKAIGPLLLILMSLISPEKRSFSYFIIPQALFKTFSQFTSRLIRNVTGQVFLPFYFDRSSPFDTNHLFTLLEELEYLQKNNGCLASDSKALMAFVLKFLEISELHYSGQDRAKELEIAEKILHILLSHAVPLIDEADTTLNVLRGMLCYSLKDSVPPNRDEVYVEAELYRIIFGDKYIKSLARVSSDPNPDPSAPPLTQELYDSKLKEALANQFAHHLMKMTFHSKETTDKMQAFLKKANHKTLVDYLCHVKDPARKKKAQELFDEQDPDVQNIIAIAGQMIGEFLRHTLTREHNMEYGLDTSSSVAPIAIPFVAAKVPSLNSQFSNRHITMAFCFQAYALEGVPKQSIEWILKQLQKRAEKEKDERSKEPDMTIEKTEAWKIFMALRGDNKDISLYNYKEKELQALVKSVNDNIQTVISFVANVVLPFLELYPEQLIFSPHNLIGLFPEDVVRAFTGTLAWMAGSLHRYLDAVFELGNTTKTSSLLFEKSNNSVTIIKEGTTEIILEQLQKIDYDLFCDAGGYCRSSAQNADVARSMSKKKPVLYYDEQNAVMMFEEGKEIPFGQSKTTHPEKRIGFLDHFRSVGADHCWKSNAKSVVTIGANMTLRDLEQAVWRLRELHLNQSVVFVVSSLVQKVILQTLKLDANTPITYEIILSFTFVNQCRQIGIHTTRALPMQLDEIVQSILIKVLIDPRVTQEGKKWAFRTLRNSWIKPAHFSAAKMYGQLPGDRLSATVVSEHVKRTKNTLDDVFIKMPYIEKLGFSKEILFSQIDDLSKTMLEKLPRTIPSNDVDMDQAMQLSLQSRVLVEAALQSENQEGTIRLGRYRNGGLTFVDFEILRNKHASFGSEKCFTKLNQTTPYDPILRDYTDLFSSRISLTINVLEWEETDKPLEQVQLLGRYRTPLNWCFFYTERNSIVLLSHGDNGPPETLYNFTLGWVQPDDNMNREELLKDFALELVQIKFLRGCNRYTQEEMRLLEIWIRKSGCERMKKLFLHIISYSETLREEYCTSSQIRDLFDKLSKEANEELDFA